MAAIWRQNFKISAKDNSSVTLVPVVDGDSSLLDTSRTVTQIVITGAVTDNTKEIFFSEVGRQFALEIERR